MARRMNVEKRGGIVGSFKTFRFLVQVGSSKYEFWVTALNKNDAFKRARNQVVDGAKLTLIK